MSAADPKSSFLRAAREWVCDGYSVDVRYIVRRTDDGERIWQALIGFDPLPAKADNSFEVRPASYIVGQFQKHRAKRIFLHRLIEEAVEGEFSLPKRRLALPKDRLLDCQSEMGNRERWFSQLHLQIFGGNLPHPSLTELAVTDDELRLSTPPFDGLADAGRWLNLVAPGSAVVPSIVIRVNPPCDFSLGNESALVNDNLTVTLLAHSKFDVDQVALAIAAAPAATLEARRQVVGAIKWQRVRDGVRRGVAKISVQKADGVLAMLVIGKSTVRRQWFLDPEKARNNRFLAVQHFDKDLKIFRHGALDTTDSGTFERAVAGLFFLLGFSPSIQAERAAPDLIVTTPAGRIALVECTTKISDFTSKIGKLVDRRGSLSKALLASGHPARVTAVLVCQLPRDQIAARADELRLHNAILITREDLIAAFDRLRFPIDPDRMLDEALAQLQGEGSRMTGGDVHS